MSDNIDIIYDKYIAKEKLKNGTKYERIVAVIFKLLYENDTVIHDLRLRGDGKKSAHQIDVTIEKNSTKKRVLVECKDYDKVVGIGIIRDFYGAVHQIKPDDAFVVTTKGYTQGAVNFATDEGIKLLVLREFQDEDWEGKMRELNINLTMNMISSPCITRWNPFDTAELEKAKEVLKYNEGKYNIDTRSTFFYDKEGKVVATFQQVLKPIFNSFPIEIGKKSSGTYEFGKAMYIDLFGTLICVRGFDYEYESHQIKLNETIDEGDRIGTLLLRSLDDSLNKIIFDQDLDKWTFADDGTVLKR